MTLERSFFFCFSYFPLDTRATSSSSSFLILIPLSLLPTLLILLISSWRRAAHISSQGLPCLVYSGQIPPNLLRLCSRLFSLSILDPVFPLWKSANPGSPSIDQGMGRSVLPSSSGMIAADFLVGSSSAWKYADTAWSGPPTSPVLCSSRQYVVLYDP